MVDCLHTFCTHLECLKYKLEAVGEVFVAVLRSKSTIHCSQQNSQGEHLSFNGLQCFDCPFTACVY